MELQNFKGVKELKVDFSTGGVTKVKGRNGSGKSTIFDAFTWVLFGKDSKGASQFSIKTQDETGEPLHKLTHAVTCLMSVDGEELEVRREYREKWVKKRGETDETFQGHEESRFINGVPYTLKDFTAKVDELIRYDVFQLVTNPRTFLDLSTDERRARLVGMAGIATDLEIAKSIGADNIAELLATKTIQELTAERKANVTRIKENLKGMPQRIEEATMAIPETHGTEEELAKEQYRLQLERAELNRKLESSEEIDSEQGRQLLSLRASQMELNQELKKEKARADELATAGYRQQKERQEKARKRVQQLEERIPQLQREMGAEMRITLEPTKARIEELRERFRKVAERTLTLELTGLCPTCGTPYSVEKLEELRATAQADFNARQARDKKEINEEGKMLNKRLKEAEERVATQKAVITEAMEELEQLKQSEIYLQEIGEEPIRTELTAKEQRLSKQIEELEQEIEAKRQETTSDLTKGLREERDEVQRELDEVLNHIAEAKRATAQRARVQELEERHKELNQELAKAERDLQELNDFQKERMALVEQSVNSLFHTLTWRMYRDQINGGQQEVCEPLIGGVPYQDANNAARINAGVDICQAIGRHEGIQAPIFIDNAEAVNNILPTEAQQVHLLVTSGVLEIV